MNNRKSTNARKKQVVMSEKSKILVGKYITDHCLEKATKLGLNREEALERFGKNKYRNNPNAKVIKVINHY